MAKTAKTELVVYQQEEIKRLKIFRELPCDCASLRVHSRPRKEFASPSVREIPAPWPTGKGFADLAFIPLPNSGGRPPMIIELKYDKTADSAIKQIKERRYDGALSGFGDEILLVGINYDKEDKGKKHTCVIESVSGNLSK